MFRTRRSDKVTPTYLKKHNETLLLRAIYEHEAISRVQLANLTNLSRPSVTELTQGLIKRGLISEIGTEQVTDKVGKKPTLLALNPDAYQMVVVTIADTEVIGALLDLRMHVLVRETTSSINVTGRNLVIIIEKMLQSLIEKATRPLLGIAIASPGIIDSHSGIVHLASNLDWIDLPLADELAEQFDLPVYIGNDSNLAAIGEHRFGLGEDVDDLLVIRVGSGIGVGILAGGRIIHGNAFGAGELGHSPIPNVDDECICGRHGCLETQVSLWAVMRDAKTIMKMHPESLLNQLVGKGEVTITAIQEAIKQQDVHTIELVRTVGNRLGQALIIVINLLNPKRIILTGKLLQLGDVFLDEVRRTVQERTFTYIASQTEIIQTALGDEIILLGAGAMLLEKELGL